MQARTQQLQQWAKRKQVVAVDIGHQADLRVVGACAHATDCYRRRFDPPGLHVDAQQVQAADRDAVAFIGDGNGGADQVEDADLRFQRAAGGTVRRDDLGEQATAAGFAAQRDVELGDVQPGGDQVRQGTQLHADGGIAADHRGGGVDQLRQRNLVDRQQAVEVGHTEVGADWNVERLQQAGGCDVGLRQAVIGKHRGVGDIQADQAQGRHQQRIAAGPQQLRADGEHRSGLGAARHRLHADGRQAGVLPEEGQHASLRDDLHGVAGVGRIHGGLEAVGRVACRAPVPAPDLQAAGKPVLVPGAGRRPAPPGRRPSAHRAWPRTGSRSRPARAWPAAPA
ncbi:hypothetical protein G6F57_014694 [Rhizopus arrhizus]|nr:hypothetical protein G6F57_014694 [Rhizopus arrhizus]